MQSMRIVASVIIFTSLVIATVDSSAMMLPMVINTWPFANATIKGKSRREMINNNLCMKMLLEKYAS